MAHVGVSPNAALTFAEKRFLHHRTRALIAVSIARARYILYADLCYIPILGIKCLREGFCNPSVGVWRSSASNVSPLQCISRNNYTRIPMSLKLGRNLSASRAARLGTAFVSRAYDLRGAELED